MKPLKITLIQSSLFWEQPEKNRNHFSKLCGHLRKNDTDIILLPEMFTSGFTMNAALVAEPMNGESMQWMATVAKEKNAVVCGSLVISEKGKFYNRLIWMQPNGIHFHYNKRHLFRMAGEHKTYTAGKKRLIIQWKGWRICPLICYDLRFPVWSRNRNEYDLLLYVTNWPAKRRYAWSHLLVARAIENQCYVAGLNRVGKDEKNITYSGDSVVLNPSGEKISSFKPRKPAMETVALNARQLLATRNELPFLMDADPFKIMMHGNS